MSISSSYAAGGFAIMCSVAAKMVNRMNER